MTIDVQVEPFGPDAARALARLVAAAQAEDPLARVTVVVPNGPVGLATRRLLASGRRGTGPPGIIGVRFLRMAALAEEIGGSRVALGGRRPATAAVLLGAVRAALAKVPGPLFGPVRDHPATLSALAATYRELSHVGPADLGTLAASGGQAAEVVRLIGAVRGALVGWYDEVDVAEAARAVIDEDPVTSLADLGPVIVYLPLTMVPAHEQLLRAIARHTAVTVLLGCTGDPAGDEPAMELAGRLGGRWPSRVEQAVVGGQLVVEAPSADAEVLLALRQVMDRHRRGTPLERMALVYGAGEPYARLVRETLDQAHIPFNGRGIRPLSATLAGRILLGAFALADNDWRRDEVMAWMASAPIAFDGRPVPGTAWDLLSAEAGVTAGLPGWREHLTTFAEDLRSRSEVGTGDAGGVWRERALATATRLLGFIERLAARLGAPPATWDGWARWARALLQDLSGGQNRAAGWPPEEAAAFTAVEDSLAGLGLLDEVDPGPSATAFRSALSSELEAPAPQTSRFGRGLLVGRIGDLIGLDLETIVVIGMTDAAFPGRVADDPLVPDAQRSAHPTLPLRGARASEARRDYLAALASADVRILSYARGDQRGGRVQRPSRWLLDSLGALAAGGRRLYLGDLAGLDPHPAFVQVPSYAAAVAGSGEPLSIDDRDLRSLVRWTADHRTVSRHFLVGVDPVLRRGLETQRGRREGAFTRFDGRIEGQDVPSPANGRQQSATGLEAYAACPRRYLFERVLRISVRERPEEIVSISALDRGTMVHQILQEFIGEQVALPPERRIRPTTPWGPGDQAHLLSLADGVFAEFAQRGLTGRALFWEVQRSAIVRDLKRFLIEDSRYRAENQAVPEAVEYRFGYDGSPPVAVPLDDRRTVRFRGAVDRVDRLPDRPGPGAGPVYVVIDYKTGGAYGVDGLKDDPVARGTRLQLPIYGLAMRQHMGAAGVQARYWFVSDKGGFAHHGYELTPPRLERAEAVLRVLVDGIEAGNFPARPAQGPGRDRGNCGICPFDAVCPTDRQAAWERKRGDPVLAAYAGLAEADGTD